MTNFVLSLARISCQDSRPAGYRLSARRSYLRPCQRCPEHDRLGIMDKSRTCAQDGAGLELWRRIVELHGGTLETTSILGEGTTVRTHLKEVRIKRCRRTVPSPLRRVKPTGLSAQTVWERRFPPRITLRCWAPPILRAK